MTVPPLMVPADDVLPGSSIAIHPGERVPLDGEVVDGTSSVDEAPITGESVPVDKAAGDRLYAGSLNQHGALRVSTTATAGDSAITRLVELQRAMQRYVATQQELIDRASVTGFNDETLIAMEAALDQFAAALEYAGRKMLGNPHPDSGE